MKNLKNITRAQGIALFEDYKNLSASGVTFSSLSYLVDVSESKTVQGKKLLKKFIKINATIGADYAKKVMRIVKNKQGEIIDFVAQPMNGKDYYIDGAPVVKDTKTGTKTYLVFIVENHTSVSARQLYIASTMEEVTKEQVWNEEYITPAGLKPRVESVGRGAVEEENAFAFRTVDFDNVKGFVIGGTDYRIID